MIEILLVLCATLLLALCLLGIRIARRFDRLQIHVTIDTYHFTARPDDDDSDPSESWKNN